MSNAVNLIGLVEKVGSVREHRKASERYQDVRFFYPDGAEWVGSIPIEYRRTAVDLYDPVEIDEYILEARDLCDPNNWPEWKAEQEVFWQGKKRADVTKPFFDVMLNFDWICSCQFPPNPNPQRRIQDIKQFGFTIASYPNRYCPLCQGNKIAHLLVPIPRNGARGYEVFSPLLRAKIVRLLEGFDVYEGKKTGKDSLLPDHKFPEVRWDEHTPRLSLEMLSDDEIRSDFQLLSNHRNEQKRETCRNCYQSGKRGYPLGIKFYYSGDEEWPSNVSRRGKEAEVGCLGCGWYDMKAWRQALQDALSKS